MISDLGKELDKRGLINLLVSPKIGLEVERQRIDGDGNISKFPYPHNIGDQQTNQWITNDFMQTMSEVVTPVAHSTSKALRYLEKLSNILRAGLADGEYLWPLSMPPALPLDRSQVDVAHANHEKRKYFFTWLKHHPLEEATPCGFHINIGFNRELLAQVGLSVQEQNDLYLHIAQEFLRYRFVFTYLFGASPIAEKNYFLNQEGPKHAVRSIRQSHWGFGTKFDGDFTSVENYVRRIHEGVDSGILLAEHDFHSPVRLRGTGNAAQLLTEGISHLEVRMLDLDPWSSVGISSDALSLTVLLAAFFAVEESDPFDLAKANQQNEQVALEVPGTVTKYCKEIRQLLNRLRSFIAQVQLGENYYALLERIETMVDDPSLTVNGRLVKQIQDNSLVNFGVKQALAFQSRSQQALNVYAGFGKDNTLTADQLRDILN